MSKIIANFEAMLARGQDNALLRFSLGNALLGENRAQDAATHLKAAVKHDPNYSAAWKLLGKALAQADDPDGAKQAYETGITAAEARGDIQAAKEMKVFLKRLAKASDA